MISCSKKNEGLSYTQHIIDSYLDNLNKYLRVNKINEFFKALNKHNDNIQPEIKNLIRECANISNFDPNLATAILQCDTQKQAIDDLDNKINMAPDAKTILTDPSVILVIKPISDTLNNENKSVQNNSTISAADLVALNKTTTDIYHDMTMPPHLFDGHLPIFSDDLAAALPKLIGDYNIVTPTPYNRNIILINSDDFSNENTKLKTLIDSNATCASDINNNADKFLTNAQEFFKKKQLYDQACQNYDSLQLQITNAHHDYTDYEQKIFQTDNTNWQQIYRKYTAFVTQEAEKELQTVAAPPPDKKIWIEDKIKEYNTNKKFPDEYDEYHKILTQFIASEKEKDRLEKIYNDLNVQLGLQPDPRNPPVNNGDAEKQAANDQLGLLQAAIQKLDPSFVQPAQIMGGREKSITNKLHKKKYYQPSEHSGGCDNYSWIGWLAFGIVLCVVIYLLYLIFKPNHKTINIYNFRHPLTKSYADQSCQLQYV
jgi:hypothetical protein